MEVETTSIAGVLLFTTARFGDERGFFSTVYARDAFVEAGLPGQFVQDNHSKSGPAGTVRGLHFQSPPHAQGKLVRVVRGSIIDVAVDIRLGSPTYGRHVAAEISAENWRQIYVPPGFAHGFCTLESDTEVIYKVTSAYAPSSEGGLAWNDPNLGIQWPVRASDAVLSARDHEWPKISEFASPFSYTR